MENKTSQPSQKSCCNKCNIYDYSTGILGCAKPQCECHKEAKIRAGAKDFAERFEGVMKDLAEEEAAGDWKDEIRDLAKEYATAAWAASEEKYAEAGEVTAMDKILASVESLLTRVREEAEFSATRDNYNAVEKMGFDAGREEGARAARIHFIQWAKDHYWDSLDREIVLLHLNAYLSAIDKSNGA